jgi:hypothetical protein
VTAAGFVWDPRVATHVYRDDHPLKPKRLIGCLLYHLTLPTILLV